MLEEAARRGEENFFFAAGSSSRKKASTKKRQSIKQKPSMKAAAVKKKPSKISATADTQCVDRWRGALDRFIPAQLHRKLGKGGAINEHLFTYVFAFVWRDQVPHDAGIRAEIGALCARGQHDPNRQTHT